MSISIVSLGSSVSQLLRTTKKILQDVTFDAKIATTLNDAEARVLEQDALEVLRLIRSWRNTLAPIHRIPLEVLTLIPDFWDTNYRDRDVIALSHTCRTWRGIFTSHPSLWSDFGCNDADKTHVYLERSKASPINLWLDKEGSLSPHDPFFQIIPRAIGRLKSLSVDGRPQNLQDITAHLSYPAPLLEYLSIDGGCKSRPDLNPVLSTTLFNGDLSSLHVLQLRSVRTELPWRNMINLTSFSLGCTPPGEISIGQLLDFLENAPRLRKIQLHFATPTSGAQDGRLVSLACLRTMDILGGAPCSLLLDHLLIPVGAKLRTRIGSLHHNLEGHFPTSLDNLRNFSNFTTINLYIKRSHPEIRYKEPNGQFSVIPAVNWIDFTTPLLGYLTQFGASKTKRLRVVGGDPPTVHVVSRTLSPMQDLRTLAISQCNNLYTFIHSLSPEPKPSSVVVCPKLEELVLDPLAGGEEFDIQGVIGMAAARASRGAKLKSVKILSQDKYVQRKALELGEYVLHTECGPDVDVASDDSDGSDEED